MTDLYLIRHGETDANANAIIQGWLDIELNEKGRNQAEEAAKSFNEPIDAIYSSDLLRTEQTAIPFEKKFPDVPRFEDMRLRERNFGDVTGQPRDSIDWDEFWSVPTNQQPVPHAESVDDFNDRVRLFIDDLRNTPYKQVLIVTHSGTINRFRELINGDEHRVNPNASVTHLTI